MSGEPSRAAPGAGRPGAARRRRWLDPLPVLGLAGTIGLWYVASWAIGRYMPPPHEVFVDAVANLFHSDYFVGLGLPAGGFLPHVAYTAQTVVIGVAIGTVLGCLSGVASARWRVVDQITDPFMSTLGTVPILVAAPFFLIWFGLVGAAQAILVSFYATVIMHIYSIQAVRNLHPKYVEYAQTPRGLVRGDLHPRGSPGRGTGDVRRASRRIRRVVGPRRDRRASRVTLWCRLRGADPGKRLRRLEHRRDHHLSRRACSRHGLGHRACSSARDTLGRDG